MADIWSRCDLYYPPVTGGAAEETEPSDERSFSTFRIGHHLSQEEISRGYERIADLITMPPYFYPHVARIGAPRQRPGYVVDVGCGNGQLLEQLITLRHDKNTWHYIGLEPSAALARSAALRLGERAVVLRGSGTPLPLADGLVRTMYLTEVVEHLARPIGLLREVRRVLAPDGIVIVTMPNVSAYEPFWRHADALRWSPVRRRLLPSEHPSRSVQPIDTGYLYDGIRALLAYSGFDVIEIHGKEYLPPLIHGLPAVGSIIWRNLSFWDALVGKLVSPRWAYRLIIVAKRTP